MAHETKATLMASPDRHSSSNRLRSYLSAVGRRAFLGSKLSALAAVGVLTLGGLVSYGIAQNGTGGVNGDFVGGTVTEKFTIPAGATSAIVELIDEDVFSDDVLFKGSSTNLAALSELVVNVKWICIDGEVVGPHGESGEETAEVFVRVTFNNGDVKKSSIKELTCPS